MGIMSELARGEGTRELHIIKHGRDIGRFGRIRKEGKARPCQRHGCPAAQCQCGLGQLYSYAVQDVGGPDRMPRRH